MVNSNHNLDLIEQIKQKLIPKDEDKRKLEVIEKILEERLEKLDVRYELGGSYAHDTWLKGLADIDFFLVYPPSLGASGIAKKGLDDAKKVLAGLEYRRRYAEHPYLEGFINGIRVNLVPCADTELGKWITSIDRSRFHTAYMKEHLDDNMKNEVRVTKAFLINQKLYGAEIRIGGFSGYVSEVLIVKYRSFLNLLNSASEWKEGELISIEGEPTSTFQNSGIFLTILDPVDPNRNLATAIKPSNIGRFILLSRKFIEKPDITYFFKPKSQKVPSKEIFNHVIIVIFPSSNEVEDIRWGEYIKSSRALTNRLKENGFLPIRVAITERQDMTAFAILLEHIDGTLNVKRGPSIFDKVSTKKFLLSNSILTWIDDDMRSYSVVKINHIESIVKEVLLNPEKYGVSKGIVDNIRQAEVIVNSKKIKSQQRFLIKDAIDSLFKNQG